jgi:hypothetical protein
MVRCFCKSRGAQSQSGRDEGVSSIPGRWISFGCAGLNQAPLLNQYATIVVRSGSDGHILMGQRGMP